MPAEPITTETPKLTHHVENLERLWDMVSDMVEGGRLTEADIPDDYQALVSQMVACNASHLSR